MASGLSRSLRGGHDEFVEWICVQCESSGTNNDATVFCMDCNEHYCDDCIKFHKRIKSLKEHKILNKNQKEAFDKRFKENEADLKLKSEQIKRLTDEAYEFKEILREQEIENEDLAKKHAQLKDEYVKVTLEKKNMDEELCKKQKGLDMRDGELDEVYHQLEYFDNKLTERNKTIDKLQAENSEWMFKFGKMSSEMIESSPDVTVLGDPDRASRLAERYKDMYDNTWTKTYVAQRRLKKFQEKDIVKNLLDILTGAFSFCGELAQAQESSLRSILLHPIQEKISGIQMKQIEINPQLQQKMKELRKQFAVGSVEEIKQAYFNCERKKIERSQSDAREEVYDKADLIKRKDVSKDFYRKCVELCWPMVLHDPPLYLEVDIKPGDTCNRDLYTMRSEGDQVMALVWPPLFQGKGGPLLAQGVVEGLKTVKKTR